MTTFSEVDEPPNYFKKEVKQSSEMNFDELKAYIRELEQGGFDVVRLKVQLYRKLSFPLITLVMSILAIPFAVSAGRQGALRGVATAIGIDCTTKSLGGSLFSFLLPCLINAVTEQEK